MRKPILLVSIPESAGSEKISHITREVKKIVKDDYHIIARLAGVKHFEFEVLQETLISSILFNRVKKLIKLNIKPKN
jgi:hypothetical protein